MSKFHINKHGVPAPCKATKGNCPLGGDSGEEAHFDTAAEAQAHVDEVNQKEHGWLAIMDDSSSDVNDVEISEESYSNVFRESYNAGGYQVTGPHNENFNQSEDLDEKGQKSMNEVYESLPDEFYAQAKSEPWTLVPEYNIESHMKNHVMAPTFQKDFDQINEMNKSIEKEDSSYVEEDGFGGPEYEMDDELSDDISEFSANKLKEESTFSINGNKMTVFEHDSKRNWAQEYIDSGRFEEFKKTHER